MKRVILIHGAENFLGRQLVSALAASDWAEPLPIASGSLPGSTQHLAKASGIVHCILGSASRIERHAIEFYRTLEDVGFGGPVVHLSSMTVYGSATGTVNERSPTPADLGPYSRAHYAAETLARRLPGIVILRPGAEYGTGCTDWSGRIAHLLKAKRLGDLGAGGDGLCNLTYVCDLIEAIEQALRREDLAGEIFNVATDETLTWNDYFVRYGIALGAVPVRRLSARRLRLEKKILAPPLKIAELLGRVSRIDTRVLPPAITSSLLRTCRQEIRLDVAKLTARLGTRSTPVENGLRQAAAYWS